MKTMPDNKSLASSTIFDEIGYDEMQKAENHEIGFKLFRIMFFVVLVLAYMLLIICSDAGNVAGTVLSGSLFAAVMIFYVLYAYMTAKRGIMNAGFAKGWSAKWVTFAYIVLGVLWIIRLVRELVSGFDLYDIAFCAIWLIIITVSILMSLCARLNNRVLKKQLEESEAAEE